MCRKRRSIIFGWRWNMAQNAKLSGTRALRLIARPIPRSTQPPRSIDYGDTFSVEIADIADAADIGPVNILRLGSVTHTYDFDQRICGLDYAIQNVQTTVAQLSVSAPASANDCPPGPYMLFALNGSGVAPKGLR